MMLALLAAISCGRGVSDPVFSGRSPRIFPDYSDVTVPATIAPLNFTIDNASRLDVTLTGDDSTKGHKTKCKNVWYWNSTRNVLKVA